MLTYRIYQNLKEEITGLDDLLEISQTPTIFQTKEYLLAWSESFIKDQKEIFLIAVLQDEKLVGFAPMRKKDNKLTFLGTDSVGDNHDLVTDFGDIAVLPGMEDVVWKEIFKAAAENKISVVELDYLRQSSTSFGVLQKQGALVSEMMDQGSVDVSPYLTIPIDFDKYLEGLERKARHELRRKMRRLDAGGYAVTQSFDPQQLKEFIRLHKASTIEKDVFMSKQMEDFFQRISENLGKKKAIIFQFMEIDRKNVAATVAFLWKNEYWLYNSGFDRNYEHLSTGFLLKAMTIKYAIEKRMKKYSFLRGNERYKYDLGAKDDVLYKALVRLS